MENVGKDKDSIILLIIVGGIFLLQKQLKPTLMVTRKKLRVLV